MSQIVGNKQKPGNAYHTMQASKQVYSPKQYYDNFDYCNSLLAGVADVYLRRLQSVQNAAANLVSGAHRHDHITPILVGLHWHPVLQRIIYKTAVLVWKCLHDAAPSYLADLCVPAHSVHGRQQLR